LLKSDLWFVLKWLFKWIRKPKKVLQKIESPPAPVIAGEQGSAGLFNVRELYQALLWQGRKLGFPRQSAETPYEYGRKLKSNLTMMEREIDTLTEAYVVSRYSLSDPPPEKVTFLNEIWRSFMTRTNSINQNKDQ
jgi:hypothetical protein